MCCEQQSHQGDCGHHGHHGDHGHHEDHGPHGHHGHHSHHGHDCCCGSHQERWSCGCHGSPGARKRFERRYWTKEEIIAELEVYLASLQAEARAVSERIEELKGQ